MTIQSLQKPPTSATTGKRTGTANNTSSTHLPEVTIPANKATKNKEEPSNKATKTRADWISTEGKIARPTSLLETQGLANNDFHHVVATLENHRHIEANKSIRIFQIYYEDWQKDLLDPSFSPLNNSAVKAEKMEFDVFERLSRSRDIKKATLWGALSWRYREKTGMHGAHLLKIIAANPGADIYYCNPHVHNEALFHNMWLQGETAHPQFLKLSMAFFSATGLDIQELNTITASSAWSAANYFVGSKTFWSKYIPFVRQLLITAEKKLSDEMRALLHAETADDKGLHSGSTYVPFIVERLFPLFMQCEGKSLKAFKIVLPERERELNVHLRLLRDMKDVAHRTRSPWLAACWVNYRNLYLSQSYGKAWCQRYLRTITPAEIQFT